MAPSKFSSALVLALASAQTAVAAPLDSSPEYREVIPGDGLPSLESLGFTSAQLYETPIPEPGDMHLLAGKCGPSNSAYTNVDGIIACYNYLKGLGTQQCTASNAGTIMCRAGDAVIFSESLRNSDSSYCRDVASAVLWTINSCTRPDKSCAGNQAASGNGNLRVGSYARRYVPGA